MNHGPELKVTSVGATILEKGNLSDPSDNEVVRPRKLRPWISALLVVIGLSWVGWLVFKEGAKIVDQLNARSTYWFAFSLVLGTASLCHNGIIFHQLLRIHVPKKVPFTFAYRLFFNGQMIRHLPGRFWGVIYQVNESRVQFPPVLIIAANMDFLLLSMSYSIIVPLVIYFYFEVNSILAIVSLIIGAALGAAVLYFDWVRVLFAFVHRCFPRRFACYPVADRKGIFSWRLVVVLTVLFLSQWLFYLLSWQTFVGIYPELGHYNLSLLCATYTVAWVIGFLSMITPAGMGIRESAFLFMAGSYASSAGTAFLAIFVRLWLLIIDLLLFLSASILVTIRRN